MKALASLNTQATSDPKLCLRRDLRSSLHENHGERFFMIEDPAREAFFRLGPTEWHFASKLDGKTSLRSAYAQVCEDLGQDAITPEKAQSICQWLGRSGLLKASGTDESAVAVAPEVRGVGLLVSAFFFRIPLCHPDRWLDHLLPYFRWTFSPLALAGWLLLVTLGFQSVYQHWDRFQASAAAYFSPNTWLYLAVVWVVLKVVHELFHALACKHFGGRVGASGLAFILFTPVAFVDVTSAWTFRSKWHRIWTSAAGMYVEFAIAAVAALLWVRTGSPLTQTICHSVIMAASVTTILFNGNPLMRFDGYYILTDLVEIQNLYGTGREYVRAVMRKVFFDVPTTIQPVSDWRGRLIRVYGWSAACWRILVCLSMMLGAATLFHGAGILLAAAAGFAWFAKPAIDLVRYLMTPQVINQPSVSRFTKLTVSIVLASSLLCVLPFPGGVSAPAIVDFEPLHYVRSEANGFVADVRVTTGQNVEAEEVLMTIRNDELKTQLHQVQAELRQAEIRTRILHQEDNLADYQAEQERVVALTEKLDSLQEQVRGLTVRATVAGKILSRKLHSLEGKYVEVGETLTIVSNGDKKAVLASISEEYVETFADKVGVSPHVWVRGYHRPIRQAKLARVEPSASDMLRHPALGGHAGGPIPVRAVNSGGNGASMQSQFRMVAPRFHGVVELGAEESSRLQAGQLAEVRFTDWSESIGRKVHRTITTWVRSKLGVRTAG
jgi:putative peptide zinc metalloprotease protein